MKAFVLALAPGVVLGAASCAPAPPSGEASAPAARPASAAQPAAPVAAIPQAPGRFAPGHMQIGGELSGSELTDIDTCESCHADIAAQWKTSAHAFASFNNPIYRVVVDAFRKEVSPEKSRFCGACHDVALMVDGAMDGDILPSDRRAHAGITCRTCHSIAHTAPGGNGSYTLAADPIPIPAAGDQDGIRRHIARAALTPLRTAALCATCHRAFLNEASGNAHHLIGQDDVTPWQRSAFAGSLLQRIDDPVPQQDCRSCHMPDEPATHNDAAAKDGKVASHRFLGAHTWLAAMRGDRAQIERVEQMLRGAVSIDVAAAVLADGARVLPAEGAAVAPGKRMVFDVVVRNLRVGHRFPAGTLDAQDSWIEVSVFDAGGRLLAEAGADHARSGADPTAHRLRALAVGSDGMPVLERQTNRFYGVAYNHTLPPRDAAVVEYGFDVPEALPPNALPLRISATLRHRSRSLDLQRAACLDSHTPRGQAFRRASPRADLDPCTPQPIVAIAEAEVWVGAGWQARQSPPARPAWRRLFDHALGLQHVVQERLDEGRPSLLRALEALGGETLSPSERARGSAMVTAALAELAARQGRIEEAAMWLDRAAVLAPDHPALDRIRGQAHALLWRWQGAIPPFEKAALAAPNDDSAWVALAIARGSVADAPGSLEAAQRGLSIQPRDADLLRAQALALGRLGAPAEQIDAAYRAYQSVQIADEIPRVKAKCSAKVPGCAQERTPVHLHVLRPAQ